MRMRFFAIALFTVLPGIFLLAGVHQAWSQHRKITTYLPVTMRVIATDLQRHSGKTVTWSPVVRYRYQVGGQSHISQTVLPYKQSSTRAWASRIIDQYQVGCTYQAYYNPADPSQAFLLRHYTFMPYLFIALPTLFMLVGLGVMLSGVGSGWIPAPEPADAGWFALRPAASIELRFRVWLVLAVLWTGVSLPACGHYFAVADRPYEMIAMVAASISAAIGLGLGIAAFRYRLLLSRLQDARVLINSRYIACGGPVSVRVEQPFCASSLVEELRLGLICQRIERVRSGSRTTLRTHNCHEDWTSCQENQTVLEGETLTASHTFIIPIDQIPSTPADQIGYPRYSWRLRVVTRLAGSPDYTADFALFVAPAAVASGATAA